MTDSTAEAGIEEVQEIEEIEVPEPELEPVDEDSDLETEEEGEDQEEEAEEIEFDFGGTKYTTSKKAVPEEIAQGLQSYAKNIEADYTRKTQAVAETSKSLEAREAAIQKLESLHGETLDVYGKGLAIRQELAELESYNLTALWQSDPDQARRLSDTISQKQAQFNSIISEVSSKEAHLANERQSEIQRRVQEGEQKVEKLIPGFKAKAPEVVEYVTKTFGIPEEDAKLWGANPNTAVMAYESMMYRKMTAKAKKTARPVIPDAKPVKSIKPANPKKVLPLNGDISADEYERRWMASRKRAK